MSERINAKIAVLTERRLVLMQQKEACQRQAVLLTAQAEQVQHEILACDGALAVLHELTGAE